MSEKNIIVFWDNSGFDAELKKIESFKVCTSQEELMLLDKKILKEAKGFLVLCELNWNHELKNAYRKEYAGIGLVQRFIRSKMGLKAPVVFTSVDESSTICEKCPDYNIIKTPALKHFFVKLPATAKELANSFDGLERLTDTELAYTKLLYCDMRGVLVQINHVIEGRSNSEQEKYRKDIEYVIKEQFNNDSSLLEEYRNAGNLSDFCKALIARLDSSDDIPAYDGFLHVHNHKTIRILLLEDESEKDENVKRFVRYIEELGKKAKEEKSKSLFSITVEKNMDNIEYDLKHDPDASNRKYSLVDFDVVICDIEIKDDNGELVTLGFNVVEKMAKVAKRPLYYIVTNVSRSFYDQIKNPYVRRVRLKKEVFGTKESIETFLYGIKEVYDNREAEVMEKVYKCEILFDKLFDHIHKKDAYLIQFGKPFTKEGAPKMEIGSYDDIEKMVRVKTMELIKCFLTLFRENNFKHKDGEKENFIVFDDNCKKMRKYIRDTIGLGNGNLDRNIARRERNNQDPTTDDISDFVVRLILRRFFLFVKGFIDKYKLMESFEKYKKEWEKYNKRRLFTKNDIACRAIGDQYRTLNTSERKEGRIQSRCLDETLLFSIQREPLKLTNEEDAFVKALTNGKNIYSMTKTNISSLKIDC